MRDLFARLAHTLIAHVTRRPPDFVIGRADDPYLRRWWLLPWRRWSEAAERDPTRINRAKRWIARRLPNAYLHHFMRNDDDRALHDHPWAWCSILLKGSYTEHTIAAGGIHRRRYREAPSMKFSLPSRAHRVELMPAAAGLAPCWTLFLMGPVVREWGFHCPERGWVHWRDFTDPDDAGLIGPGCGEGNGRG
ncbi:hypothetical protein J5226_12720 [Lysobacter sp. K5869]|uniref:hypothetical protein n=1 Tax=Lysobacter sp. K5869 TaxID=2820808 RepID=UPI001C05EED0|nr:hypothetical protein [Lysobacter sp. K5869]QWP79188.1 hypothetical protein J5226_12720 [Lysobacter sp. K5869]